LTGNQKKKKKERGRGKNEKWPKYKELKKAERRGCAEEKKREREKERD
jgi:hypothetical protein